MQVNVCFEIESTTTESPTSNEHQPRPTGGLMHFRGQIFALDSRVVETRRKNIDAVDRRIKPRIQA